MDEYNSLPTIILRFPLSPSATTYPSLHEAPDGRHCSVEGPPSLYHETSRMFSGHLVDESCTL